MRKLSTYLSLWAMLCIAACEPPLDSEPQMTNLSVKLSADSKTVDLQGVDVRLTDSQQTVYCSKSNADGVADFRVPIGFYSASAQIVANEWNTLTVANGFVDGLLLLSAEKQQIDLPLVTSERSRVVIKELYVGGCPMDDGSGDFAYDKYAILYNNTAEAVKISNFCMACLAPYNANATNNFYTSEGQLSYATLDFLPVAQVIWYLTKEMEIEPYSQKVIAFNSALDCTQTYSQSVDLSRADYVTYDNTFTTHTKSHPVPDASIPTQNHLRALLLSVGTGWALSKLSPALIIFSCGNELPQNVVNDPDNEIYHGPTLIANRCLKVKREWVLDGIEVFEPSGANKKRLTSDIDAGYVEHTAHQGFSLYRNVDVAATTSLLGNEEKLVWGYMGMADQIDAEASIKNGAKIIYMDTNNSSNDFHLRSRASLKKQ